MPIALEIGCWKIIIGVDVSLFSILVLPTRPATIVNVQRNVSMTNTDAGNKYTLGLEGTSEPRKSIVDNSNYGLDAVRHLKLILVA
jgi:hypothetical protein